MLDRSVKGRGRPGGAYNPAIEPTRILFVCTGNICRSPIAEGILRERAAARGIDVDVRSCGLALDGQAATSEAQRAAHARGADIGSHRSAILERAAVEGADLVIGMERQHVREAVVLSGGSLARAFTLKELVRRAEAVEPRRSDEALDAWLARIANGRRATHLIGDDDADEVADPYRRPMADYDRCADEIADLVERLLDSAWPSSGDRGNALPRARRPGAVA